MCGGKGFLPNMPKRNGYCSKPPWWNQKRILFRKESGRWRDRRRIGNSKKSDKERGVFSISGGRLYNRNQQKRQSNGLCCAPSSCNKSLRFPAKGSNVSRASLLDDFQSRGGQQLVRDERYENQQAKGWVFMAEVFSGQG